MALSKMSQTCVHQRSEMMPVGETVTTTPSKGNMSHNINPKGNYKDLFVSVVSQDHRALLQRVCAWPATKATGRIAEVKTQIYTVPRT